MPSPSATAASSVLVAVAQLTSGPDPELNLRAAASVAADAARAGAALLCLPECFDYVTPSAQSASLAHPLNGPLLARYHALATSHNLWLSLGGFHEQHPTLPASHFYNTHALLSPADPVSPVAVYRKLHLFDAVLPPTTTTTTTTTTTIAESATTAPGTALCVAHGTPVGTVGLSTCYDVRFPGVYEALRHAGAHTLLVPSAFFPGTGAAHWHALLRARAIENQCYVLAAAQVGAHPGAARRSYGHALAVHPFGNVLADAARRPGPAFVTATVDLADLAAVRRRMPVAAHRRSDVLGPPAAVGSQRDALA